MKNKKPVLIYIGNQLSKHGSTPSYMEILGPRLEADGYRLFYASSKRYQLSRLFDMLYLVVAKRNIADFVLIDTYSTRAFYYAWCISRLCRYLGKKYIPILHGGNLPNRIASNPKMCSHLFGQSVTNVVISEYLKKSVEEHGYRFDLIPNGIDIDKYKFSEREKIYNPRILWVRAFHETYNPMMAIEVLDQLLAKYPNAALTMVGPEKDGSMAKCTALAKKKGILNHISFTGKLSKESWLNLSAQHDLFINTTNYDNLPVSVIEAMALGMPVLSTDVGGIPYLVTDGENGLLVRKGNVDDMVSSITKLVQDENMVKYLSTNARVKAEQFSWTNIKDKWNDLFLRLSRYE